MDEKEHSKAHAKNSHIKILLEVLYTFIIIRIIYKRWTIADILVDNISYYHLHRLNYVFLIIKSDAIIK